MLSNVSCSHATGLQGSKGDKGEKGKKGGLGPKGEMGQFKARAFFTVCLF